MNPTFRPLLVSTLALVPAALFAAPKFSFTHGHAAAAPRAQQVPSSSFGQNRASARATKNPVRRLPAVQRRYHAPPPQANRGSFTPHGTAFPAFGGHAQAAPAAAPRATPFRCGTKVKKALTRTRVETAKVPREIHEARNLRDLEDLAEAARAIPGMEAGGRGELDMNPGGDITERGDNGLFPGSGGELPSDESEIPGAPEDPADALNDAVPGGRTDGKAPANADMGATGRAPVPSGDDLTGGIAGKGGKGGANNSIEVRRGERDGRGILTLVHKDGSASRYEETEPGARHYELVDQVAAVDGPGEAAEDPDELYDATPDKFLERRDPDGPQDSRMADWLWRNTPQGRNESQEGPKVPVHVLPGGPDQVEQTGTMSGRVSDDLRRAAVINPNPDGNQEEQMTEDEARRRAGELLRNPGKSPGPMTGPENQLERRVE